MPAKGLCRWPVNEIEKAFPETKNKGIEHVYLTTQELADLVRVKPNTVYASMCRVGHFHGIRPVRSAA